MDHLAGLGGIEAVPAQGRPRPSESSSARSRSRRAISDALARREEILRLLGAPVARELEIYARSRGLRPVDVLRAAVSQYLRQPVSPSPLRAVPLEPRPRRAS